MSRAAVQRDIVAKSEVLAKEVCVLSASLTFKSCTARNLCVVMKNYHVSKMKSFQQDALKLIQDYPNTQYKSSLEMMVDYVINRKK